MFLSAPANQLAIKVIPVTATTGTIRRLLLWLIFFLVPFLLLRLSIFSLLDQQEKDLEAGLKSSLIESAREFSQELLPERQIEVSIARTERHLGVPGPFQSRSFRFSPGDPAPFPPKSLLSALRKGFREDIHTDPLLIATIGPDGEDVQIWANPRFYTSSSQPGRKAIQEIMRYQTGGRHRTGTQGPVPAARSGKTLAQSRREKIQRQKVIERYARSLFGPFAAVSDGPDQVFSFFTTKFGGDRLLTQYRPFRAGAGPTAPLIGGYWVCFLEQSFSRSFLEKTALRRSPSARAPADFPIQRGYGLLPAMPKSRFRRTRQFLTLLAPIPHEHLFLGIRTNRHLAGKLIGPQQE